MEDMSAKYSAFVIKNSRKHDWFEVYATIARYGPIVDWRDHELDVVFTLRNIDKTQQLTSMSKLDCGSSSIYIRPVPHQPTQMAGIFGNVATEQPPTSDGGSSNILDHLNDDVLCEIFESRALDLDDLCSIGSACVRFNEAAQPAFRSYHRKHLQMWDDWPFQRTATVLRLFGDHIKSIDIHECVSRPFADITLGMIAYHCRNVEHLKCASLMQISRAKARFDRRTANGIVEAMPFGKLGSLALFRPAQSSHYPTGAVQPLPHVLLLPSLRDVDIALYNDTASDGTRQLFATHPRIKRMRLHFGDFELPVEPVLQPSSEVEELELHGNPMLSKGSHLVFGQLKHLRALKCSRMNDCAVRQIVEAMGAAGVPLERLEYQTTMQPAVAIAIAKISSLKYINCALWWWKGGFDLRVTTYLTSMAAGPKLQEIRLHIIDYVKFDDIHELLTKAPDQLKAVKCVVRRDWMDAQLLTNNRRTIATIDRMAKDRGIRLHVDVYYPDEEHRAEVKAQLQQFSDWLTVR